MSGERKMDRRALYTQKAIKEAFLRIKRNKDYNAITVADICREAEISR
ncbi:MAG: TetR/AcrR family transcriptional regulator, partial [Oscillospiraceae bacterium]|nr:TetR/AcrR family transcriptional regulator [Oscillospiraceae bacterium]